MQTKYIAETEIARGTLKNEGKMKEFFAGLKAIVSRLDVYGPSGTTYRVAVPFWREYPRLIIF